VKLTEACVTQGDIMSRDRRAGEQSVSSALEHLAAGSHGVISKRIELALLDVHELLSRTLQRAALVGVGLVVASAAWFAVAACVVLLVTPDASLAVRLAAFGLLNWGVALGHPRLGLGLAISRRSVEENGGELRVRDVPGTGCVFTIDLPRHSVRPLA